MQHDNKDTESDQIFILNDDKQHLCQSWCLGPVLWGVGPSHNPSLQKWETYLETPQHPGRSCRKPPCSRLQIHIQSERLGARWTSEGSHHQHVYTMRSLRVCKERVIMILTCTIPGSAATFPICFMAGRNPPTPEIQERHSKNQRRRIQQVREDEEVKRCWPPPRQALRSSSNISFSSGSFT